VTEKEGATDKSPPLRSSAAEVSWHGKAIISLREQSLEEIPNIGNNELGCVTKRERAGQGRGAEGGGDLGEEVPGSRAPHWGTTSYREQTST